MNNNYFIMRHGENIWQVERKGLIYPRGICKEIKLTKKGKEDVRKVLSKIKKKGIDLIFSSDFQRTRETANIAARELGIKKINFDKRLRDIDLGVYHRKPKEEFLQFVGYKKRKFSTRPLKGESWDNVRERVRDFIQSIENKYKGKNVLIVGHGDPLCLLEGLIKRKNNQQILKDFFGSRYIKTAELRKMN